MLKKLSRRVYRVGKICLNYDFFTAIIMATVIVVHKFLRSLFGPLETALFLFLFFCLSPLLHLGFAFDAGHLFLLLFQQLAFFTFEGFEACVLFELGNEFFSQLNGALLALPLVLNRCRDALMRVRWVKDAAPVARKVALIGFTWGICWGTLKNLRKSVSYSVFTC